MARSQSRYLDSLYSSPHQRSSPLRRDSPARSPAQHELEQIFETLNLQDKKHATVYYHQRLLFQEELDTRQRIKAESDDQRLKACQASRNSVREEAEAALLAHLKVQEDEKRRLREEAQRHQEEEARRKAEAQQRAREEEQRRVREQTEQEEAAKRAEADRLRREEEQRRKATEDAQRRDTERQQQEAEDSRKHAEAEAAVKQQEEQAKASAAAAAASVPKAAAPASKAASAGIEKRHRDYLDLHRRLKKFRAEFWEQAKGDKTIKARVGEMRRDVRKHVGQLRIDGPVENRTAIAKIKTIISSSIQDTTCPRVSVNDYLPSHTTLPDPSATTISSLTIYLLSILSKALIAVSITSCVDNPKAAEAPGLMVAQVFSMPALQFTDPASSTQTPHPASLVSILLAKFHASAPQLFGINAPEHPPTQANMIRVGWRREANVFVGEQNQYDRLIGLGSLWATSALRNFARARTSNPIPPLQFWESAALIINTPAAEMQIGQLILLRHMLMESVDRIICFWGATGVALLREAVVNMPKRLEGRVANHQSAKALELLVERWAKNMNFDLSNA